MLSDIEPSVLHLYVLQIGRTTIRILEKSRALGVCELSDIDGSRFEGV